MDTTKLEIQTENLLLVSVNLNYKKDIFRELTPGIVKWMTPKSPTIIRETIQFLRDAIKKNKNGTDFNAVITLKETGEYLGGCGIHKIKTKFPSLGLWVKKSAHGNAYGKEAITALKNWADENLSYEYINYEAVNINYASRRIPESLGGKVFKGRKFKNGYDEEFDVIEYRIYPLN